VFAMIAAMVAGVLIVRILANTVAKIICHWCDVSLKTRLVEAGMAPREIEQVLMAGKKKSKSWKQGCRAAKQFEKDAKSFENEYSTYSA